MKTPDDDDSLEYYESHEWKRDKADEFDVELMSLAEKLSDKWVELYKNTAHDDDNLTPIIDATAIGGHNINRFNKQNAFEQHLNPHPDSIIEQNKLILLDKKYFEFEPSAEKSVTTIPSAETNDKNDIKTYATVFDHSDDKIENDLESEEASTIAQVNEQKEPPAPNCKLPQKTQIKTSSKKKKGRTKYRPLAYDEITSTSAADARKRPTLAAPPGVKALTSSLMSPRRMDLSKNGNYSLQFRL